MDLKTRNMIAYILIGAAGVIAGSLLTSIGEGKITVLEGQSVEWLKDLIVALLIFGVPILTTFKAAFQPRVGSEQIAAQVDAQREMGVPRRDMVVEDVEALGRDGLTEAQKEDLLARATEIVERERRRERAS